MSQNPELNLETKVEPDTEVETDSDIETDADSPDLVQQAMKLLAQGVVDVTELCEKLATDPANLSHILNSRDFNCAMQLHIHVAQTSLKLQAVALLPQTLGALKANLTCDKPEVVRRTTTTLLAIAGVPTAAPKPAPVPWLPTPPLPEPVSAIDRKCGFRVDAGLELLAEALRTRGAYDNSHHQPENYISDEYVSNVLAQLDNNIDQLQLDSPPL